MARHAALAIDSTSAREERSPLVEGDLLEFDSAAVVLRVVLFTHQEEAKRTATIEEYADEARVIIEYLDKKLKVRRKTCSSKAKYDPFGRARESALRFLFKEGFILRAPQSGAIQWLTQTHEPYPRGAPFCVDSKEGQIWVADTGYLRRVEPGTCETTNVSVGGSPRGVVCNRQGSVVSLIDLEKAPFAGSPPWREPTPGPWTYGLLRVKEGEARAIATISYEAGAPIFDGVGLSDNDLILGPHSEGAAVYDFDGKVVETYRVEPTEHHSPKAAISPSGRWRAFTAPRGGIRIVDQEGDSLSIASKFSQVLRLSVSDEGICAVGGFGPQDWGLYRVSERGVTRLSSDFRAALSMDGETLVEVQYGRVVVRRLGGPPDEPPLHELDLPWLGMAKYGHGVFIQRDRIVVRTDTHTLAEIVLP